MSALDDDEQAPERVFVNLRHRCSECGVPIVGRRDRLTCSARCRVARARRLAALRRG